MMYFARSGADTGVAFGWSVGTITVSLGGRGVGGTSVAVCDIFGVEEPTFDGD